MQLGCDVSIAKNSFASLGIMLRKFGILWGCLCKSHREGARGVPIAISGGGVRSFEPSRNCVCRLEMSYWSY